MNLPREFSPILHFAPLEGYSDKIYREFILRQYPSWNFLWTDFFRLPTHGKFKESALIDHIGKTILETHEYQKKTVFQILTSLESCRPSHLKKIAALPIERLDINAGCPSRMVNANHGGAYLLSDPELLKTVVGRVRDHFPRALSVKIRLGISNDEHFFTHLKNLESLGVDHITIHPRTKDELYKGHSSWQHFQKAAKHIKTNLIANGDIAHLSDCTEIYKKSHIQEFMIGRNAVRDPNLHSGKSFSSLEFSHLISNLIIHFQASNVPEFAIIKRAKSLLAFDPPITKDEKSRILRATTLQGITSQLDHLSKQSVD